MRYPTKPERPWPGCNVRQKDGVVGVTGRADLQLQRGISSCWKARYIVESRNSQMPKAFAAHPYQSLWGEESVVEVDGCNQLCHVARKHRHPPSIIHDGQNAKVDCTMTSMASTDAVMATNTSWSSVNGRNQGFIDRKGGAGKRFNFNCRFRAKVSKTTWTTDLETKS